MTAKKQESKGKLITKDKELTPAWYVAKRVLNVHNVTYNDMAEKLGVSVTTVHDLCNYAPNIVRVKQMADALGVSLEELLGTQKEYFLDAETAAIAQEVHDRPELKAMFNQLRKASPDSIRLAAEVIEKIARPNGE